MSSILDENDLKELFSEHKEETPTVSEINKQALPTVPPELPDEIPVKTKVPEKTYQPKKAGFNTFVNFFCLFVGIFIVSYVLINFSAVLDKSRWFLDVNLKKKTYSKAVAIPSPDPFNPASEAHLVIPKIGTDAPILWNVPEEEVNQKLIEGIIHSKGTALPGQIGNVFLTGHSSYYSWVDSNYKDVFALLDKLEENDKIYIKYGSNIFTYVVQDKKVVKPDDISVMDQGSDYELSLMTCVPIGTNLNRLIIKAKQINLSGPTTEQL